MPPGCGEAFLEDTDGVLIIGCLRPSCCLPENDVEAFLHLHNAALALHRLGVERHLAPGLIAAFRRRVIALGPRFEARRSGAGLGLPEKLWVVPPKLCRVQWRGRLSFRPLERVLQVMHPRLSNTRVHTRRVPATASAV
jgi:hypothetical protein